MSTITTIPQLKSMLANDNVKARFKEILGKKAPGFISSIVAVANSNTLLQKAEPQSIMNAAVVAATLDLPINPILDLLTLFLTAIKRNFKWAGEVLFNLLCVAVNIRQ